MVTRPILQRILGAVTAIAASLGWTALGWGSEWLPLLAQGPGVAQANRIPASRNYLWETLVVAIVSLVALYSVCRTSRRQ